MQDNTALKQKFTAQFGYTPQWIFSAPGRTELSGNHTDHQHGIVLAAAVDLDTRAAVADNGQNCIRLFSEGYCLYEIPLPAGEPQADAYGTTASLISGVAARFAALGYPVRGFDAYVESRVLSGSGLSSSAAFEVLIGVILNHMGSCGLSAAEIAKIGQYAENVYFGKPCGLMDQTASAVGNIITIDFADHEHPKIEPLAFDFSACGYSLCIIDSGASHADLTDCYAAITNELKAVCACFGKEVLRDIPEEDFYRDLPAVRQKVGDRAVLRAIHVYEENKRVKNQVAALRRNDFDTFLQLAAASGESSWMLLQNVIPEGRVRAQEMAYALTVTAHLLDGHGACRVHGGGFAGTIQAFVPNDRRDAFRAEIERLLGAGSCHVLSIRPEGGILMEECR